MKFLVFLLLFNFSYATEKTPPSKVQELIKCKNITTTAFANFQKKVVKGEDLLKLGNKLIEYQTKCLETVDEARKEIESSKFPKILAQAINTTEKRLLIDRGIFSVFLKKDATQEEIAKWGETEMTSVLLREREGEIWRHLENKMKGGDEAVVSEEPEFDWFFLFFCIFVGVFGYVFYKKKKKKAEGELVSDPFAKKVNDFAEKMEQMAKEMKEKNKDKK